MIEKYKNHDWPYRQLILAASDVFKKNEKREAAKKRREKVAAIKKEVVRILQK